MTQMGSEERYQPLLLGLDSHARIPDLSSVAIEEFLEHKPVALRWWPRLIGWESRLLWLLSGASIVVSIFNYMLSFVTLMFTGHLGALELAGASIASVGIQGLAYGIMVCFSSFASLCLQSYCNSIETICLVQPFASIWIISFEWHIQIGVWTFQI